MIFFNRYFSPTQTRSLLELASNRTLSFNTYSLINTIYRLRTSKSSWKVIWQPKFITTRVCVPSILHFPFRLSPLTRSNFKYLPPNSVTALKCKQIKIYVAGLGVNLDLLTSCRLYCSLFGIWENETSSKIYMYMCTQVHLSYGI